MRTELGVKTAIRRLVALGGYALVRTKEEENLITMEGAFRAIAKRKHLFNTVIDIGASNGSWTRRLMDYVPQCQYLLIEARPVHEKALIQFGSEHNNVQFVLAAGGEKRGRINFDATDPLGGQASYTPYVSNNIEVPVTTVDNEIRSRKLAGPYMLKLDTHGFEVPVLVGASGTLTETDVIIMGCYNSKIAPECLLFFDMCSYLKEFGFRCIDAVDPRHRPCDGAFWQMDLVFVKHSRPEFSLSRYR